jgi:hypothetical protein
MPPVVIAILLLLVTHIALRVASLYVPLSAAANTTATVVVAASLCVWLLYGFGIVGNIKDL